MTAPTVDQIWYSLLSKKGATVWSPLRDARNVMVTPHLGGGTGTLDMNWQALTPD